MIHIPISTHVGRFDLGHNESQRAAHQILLAVVVVDRMLQTVSNFECIVVERSLDPYHERSVAVAISDEGHASSNRRV